MRPSEQEFEAFLMRVERRVHRGLLSSFGVEEGRRGAQAALTWAWEHWDKVQGLRDPAAYLYRVGVTAVTRDRPREVPLADPQPPIPSQPSDVEPELLQVLASLPTQQRAAVLLVHGFGYSTRETAAVLGISVSTVRVHIQRGLKRLRQALEVNDVA